MIIGVITDQREAVIRLTVHGPAGQDGYELTIQVHRGGNVRLTKLPQTRTR